MRIKRAWRAAISVSIVTAVVAAGASFAAAGVIIDQRGQRILLDKPAERVVFLPMPGPAMYIAIDGTDRHIAAMNPSSKIAMRDGLLSTLFPGTNNIPTDVVRGASFMPNVESILALHPDAVFQWDNVGTDAIAPLERAGLTVFGMQSGRQEDLVGSIAMMGQVAGKQERAQALIRKQAERAQEIANALKNLREDQRPRVLYIGRFSDSLSVSGSGSYNDFCIRLAGGTDVANSINGTVRVVTLEQVLVWNPDVILLGNFDKTMPLDVYNDPRWQDVQAVKTRRVYRMPLGGYRWDPPSQESALTWTWLFELLHPDRSTLSLRDDMRTWYRFLYNHDLADSEIDRILFLAQNETSAGYARFRRP